MDSQVKRAYDFAPAPSLSDAPVDLERCRTRAGNIAQKWREAICGRIATERFLQSLACIPRQVRGARPRAVDSSRNSANTDATGWQRDCSAKAGIWMVAQSPPGRPSGALRLPNQFRSLFALANCRQIYKVECYQDLLQGDGQDFSHPAWLLIPFRISLSCLGKNAFGKYATDATGFSGTTDDAALRYAPAGSGPSRRKQRIPNRNPECERARSLLLP